MILEDVLQLLFTVFAAVNLAILQRIAQSLPRLAPNVLPQNQWLNWKTLTSRSWTFMVMNDMMWRC